MLALNLRLQLVSRRAYQYFQRARVILNPWQSLTLSACIEIL